MEKIKVISINPVEGKRFESAKLSDGRSATVWDGNDSNKNLANAIRANLNVECMASLKGYNGKNGFGYNIRAFSPGISKDLDEFGNGTPSLQTIYDAKQGNCHTDGQYQKSPEAEKVVNLHDVEMEPSGDPKHDSIVAQVILMGAVGLCARGAIKQTDSGDSHTGQVLCELVNELTGAYKLALSNVKAL